VSPVPTSRVIAPPLPPSAAPVFTSTSPDEPTLVVPELKLSAPLTPLVPAFAVFIVIEPDVVAVPTPVDIEMAPPVFEAERPPVDAISPPVPVA
jgi:hypothetical protein